ncbi:hypothetical protein KKB99_07960, partial [bacterium]|nr:hypothetical protein [bacterium]MBU1025926.1 hypothetical protein [bacterium]
GGIAWGGWALSAGNFIFDAVSSQKRARCTAYQFFFNSIGIFLGAILGGYLTRIAPSGVGIGSFRLEFFTEIQFAFLVSGVIRLIVISAFLPFVKEVRDVGKPNAREVIMLFTHMLPVWGSKYVALSDGDGGENRET